MKERIYKAVLMTCSFMSLFFIVIFPNECLNGAKSSLLLWFYTIIPTLFPFFFITKIMLRLDCCPICLRRIYPYVIGILCGCPTGVMIICTYVKSGVINKNEGQRALTLIGNLSPVFLINYVGIQVLHNTNPAVYVWIIILLSSFIIWIIDIFLSPRDKKTVPAANTDTVNRSLSSDILSEIILESCNVLVIIGGYMILFGILSSLISLSPFENITITLISSLLEITNGCDLIKMLNIPILTKYCITTILCCFGGLSTAFQNKLFIDRSGLSFKNYIRNKISASAICGLLTYILIMILNHQ